MVDTRTCIAPDGLGAPGSVTQAVELINALPRPVTLSCFLESLDRPLAMTASSGTLSAQPAVGARSPRIFIFSGDLILSVVPEGEGRHLLEFGERVGARETLKAEVILPVTEPLEDGTPYAHLRYNTTVTSCGLCHRDERPAEGLPYENAYVSLAFRPFDNEIVPLEALIEERRSCGEEGSERCGVFSAIFDHGQVVEEAFPTEMETFFKR